MQLTSGEGCAVTSAEFPARSGEEFLQLVLSKSLRNEVMIQLHQDHGHQGVERITELMHSRSYWPGIAVNVKRWCQECDCCQVAKHTQPITPALWATYWPFSQMKSWL